jgi:type VI protein secretion system component Hcp
LHYFLKVDGVNGDVASSGFIKWFAVDGFDFGENSPLSAATGRATGRTQFSPLTVDIHSLSGMAALFGDEVTNKLIKSVDLVAVRDVGEEGATQTVFDLKLSNASISGLKETPGANGPESQLTFNYNKLSLTDVAQNSDGGLTPETFTTKVAGLKIAPSITSDLKVVDVPSTSPLDYFLKISGVDGDVTSEAFAKWFAVDGFDFGAVTPTFGGARTGRTQFSPLTVDIHSLAGLAPLLGDEATNKLIKSVDLVAVGQSEDGVGRTVFDLKLSNAFISSLQDSPGANGVESLMTLQFNKVALIEPSQSTTSGDGGGTFTFDLTNKLA